MKVNKASLLGEQRPFLRAGTMGASNFLGVCDTSQATDQNADLSCSIWVIPASRDVLNSSMCPSHHGYLRRIDREARERFFHRGIDLCRIVFRRGEQDVTVFVRGGCNEFFLQRMNAACEKG
jgi:hypothetical protein